MMKPCIFPLRNTPVARGLLNGIFVFALIFSFGGVDAQALRDPTVPPAEAGLSSAPIAVRSPGVEPGAMTIIVRSGRPYLAVGTRLYEQGQKLGSARIERISETEVWLREGGVLRKVSQFPGIQRRAVMPVAVPSACVASASKLSSQVVPCVHP